MGIYWIRISCEYVYKHIMYFITLSFTKFCWALSEELHWQNNRVDWQTEKKHYTLRNSCLGFNKIIIPASWLKGKKKIFISLLRIERSFSVQTWILFTQRYSVPKLLSFVEDLRKMSCIFTLKEHDPNLHKLESCQPRMLCAKFGHNRPSGSAIIPPRKRVWPFIWTS